jgi:glutamate racemase
MHDPGTSGPIGIFDSGVGGLTVLHRIAERLPNESIIYLGDTARVPYGTKSADTVVRYAKSCARVLCDRGIKMLVVACNTASAYALDALQHELPLPVLGVIVPGARRALEVTRNKRIGVIGTAGTIASGAYQDAIQSIEPGAHVVARACPLFVPLAEEGWVEGPVPIQAAQTYLAPLLEQGLDTLVLGCTHYPLLKAVIRHVAGENVTIVDSAESTARVVEETLAAMEIRALGPGDGAHFLVTDSPESFVRAGSRFLGRDIQDVEWIDISDHAERSHERSR